MKNYFIYFSIFLFITSCAKSKDYIYFQYINKNETKTNSTTNYDPKFKVDDLLGITVYCNDENSNKLFNLPVLTSSSYNRGYTNGNPAMSGYLVDKNGDIDFPLTGKIHVAELSRTQTIELIEKKLAEFVNKPIINISIQNYKITVLGEVKNPGTFLIPNERITILEALGLAGDLTITGKRTNILLIREENNQRSEHRINITSNELLNSEYYYLNQNDVIYIEPNKAKINSSMITSASTFFISTASLILTTIYLITK
jgi:polysaccharide export outer membrane protein